MRELMKDVNLKEYVKSYNRLDRLPNATWLCKAQALGAMHRWFCPQMFEQICVMDPKFEEMIKNFDGKDSNQKKKITKYFHEVLFGRYLSISFEKFTVLNDALLEYFKVLSDTGKWEEDKKEYAKYPNGGIEPNDLHDLI